MRLPERLQAPHLRRCRMRLDERGQFVCRSERRLQRRYGVEMFRIPVCCQLMQSIEVAQVLALAQGAIERAD